MTATTLTPEALSYVCTVVRDKSAIELEASKAYLIESRLGPLAKTCGFASTAELVQGVRARTMPGLEEKMVEAMTTNETSFYRDVHPFESVRTSILPDLQALKSKERNLNVWSAACSSGQELYSFAMLLAEHFPDMAAWDLNLVGTDLSDHILERARAGWYSQVEVNRGLPAPLLLKYFSRDGMNWQISDKLRKMAKFTKLNLIDLWPQMPTMDIVFLRNVLIYFSPETKKSILHKVRRTMAPHAVLFLGAAETTIGIDPGWERIQVGNTVCYRIKQ